MLNSGTLIVGGLLLIVLGVRLIRRGEWRLPPEAESIGHEPRWSDAALSLLAFAIGGMVVAKAALYTLPHDQHDAAEKPGTHAWHTLAWQDYGAKLAGATVALLAWRAASRRAGWPRVAAATQVGLGALLAIALLPILTLINVGIIEALRWSFPERPNPSHDFLIALQHSAWGAAGVWQLAIAAVVVAPIAEELFFRGVVLGAARRTTGGDWPAIVVSAVAFGAVHSQNPDTIIPLILMGFALGWLRLRTGGVLGCIVAHAVINARSVALAVLAPELVTSA